MLLGDRLVCGLVEPLEVGTQFNKWPLHVTVVPWFRLADVSEQLAQGLVKALATVEPFKATVGEEVRFGPQQNRPAHLLESDGFVSAEKLVRHYLHKKRAWLVDETTKRQWPYRPHVTFQGDKHLNPGDILSCDRLYLVEQAGDHKEVVAEIPLG